MSWWILYLLLPAVAADLVRMGCDRDPSLPFCKAQAAKTRHGEDGEEITDKDKVSFSDFCLYSFQKIPFLLDQRLLVIKSSLF